MDLHRERGARVDEFREHRKRGRRIDRPHQRGAELGARLRERAAVEGSAAQPVGIETFPRFTDRDVRVAGFAEPGDERIAAPDCLREFRNQMKRGEPAGGDHSPRCSDLARTIHVRDG